MKKTLAFLMLVPFAVGLGCDIPETQRNAFFPPDDLYVPLGTTEIDLSEAGTRHQLTVVHKYPGTHAVSVEVPVTQAYEFPLRATFALTITVEQDGVTVFDRHVNQLEHPFGRGDIGGYNVVYYEVPDELPRNIPVTVVLTVTKPDPEFFHRFESVVMSVNKIGDL